ncbi:Cof-type HAD-IIB family hydrolase [Companilactobacillus mishanensis]|uniref:Cof-type HAD-IIB family hydrolase n=1 Tax=Companilactobacillus mishanensis TaxID=2486008 RepID=A0A5P0ZFB6_9LACO|nr:Cof-type HAD-IIB family hydrolase [Companilactobacillus mishanensis]MQS51679.1 Cof-type HAD-IIB family hydrolase [Companilactobacillus mishanensis]
MMSNFKIAFFDIDGTLAAHNAGDESSILDRIPDTTRLALKELKENGIEPVIATGRNRGMISDLLKDLKIDSYIANNGRFVSFKGKTIMHDVFSAEQLKMAVSQLNDQGIPFCYETADVLYKNKSSKFIGDSSMFVKTIPDDKVPEDVIQLIIKLNNQKEQLNFNVPEIKTVKVAKLVYDVTLKGSNKAVGIKKILESTGVSAKDTIAFGDEENDLEMFDAVGYTVAMGNANPIVKNRADFITTDVNNDGIKNAVEELQLI